MSKTLKAIAAFQILSITMVLGSLLLLVEGSAAGIPVATNAVYGLMYLGVVGAGVCLWREMAIGIPLSIMAQGLQLVTFDIVRVAYRFTGVVDFFIYFRAGEGLGLDAYVGARYAWHIYDEAGPMMIGINVVALACLILLVRGLRPTSPSDEAVPTSGRGQRAV